MTLHPPGTIFRCTESSRLMFVVLGPGTCRRIDLPDQEIAYTDPITVLGRLPPAHMDATAWEERWKLPEGYDPKKHDLLWERDSNKWRYFDAGWFDSIEFQKEYDLVQRAGARVPDGDYSAEDGRLLAPAPLPVGTRFRFRNWPERWTTQDVASPGQEWAVIDDPDDGRPPFTGDGQPIVDYPAGGRWSATDGVLPTDDIELLSTPSDGAAHAKAEADRHAAEGRPNFTWRGWSIIHQLDGAWTATDPARSGGFENKDPGKLLDRIAEAEGLTATQEILLKSHSRWTTKLQDFCQEHAEGGLGRDVCDVALETALEWKEHLAAERRARETAETDRSAFHKTILSWKQKYHDLAVAFRAATGEEYDPSRDYSVGSTPKEMAAYNRGLAKAEARTSEIVLPLTQEIPMTLTADDSSNLPPGTVFKFLSFPEDYGLQPITLHEPFIMGPAGCARYKIHTDRPDNYIWPVKGCKVKILSTPNPKEKPSMSAPRRLHRTRRTAFWACVIVASNLLGTAIMDPLGTIQGIQDWLTAPTELELGDWTRVLACDDCRHVLDESRTRAIEQYGAEHEVLCPSCGAESFTARKVQRLISKEHFLGIPITDEDSPKGPGRTHGYLFQDGTDSLPPGHWVVPKRERIVEARY